MAENQLPLDALRAAEKIRKADVVIGIPSYNNARTIGHVTRAACAGLAKYFPDLTGVIVNSDGGSKDGTAQAVVSAGMEDANLLLLSTPLTGVHRLSFPYHGIPGKGSAFRLIFQMAERLEARACAVVDSDLRSITPEWFDLLLRPVLFAGYDFVAPYYHRHKYDGTITNSIVYPLTRALYGHRVRQPIGGEFGVSARLLSRYLSREDWETDIARYGIDIWMTTIALAEGFRVCQSFLGAKLHDAKDPGADLSAMLHQVVGSVFLLMQEYEPVWRNRSGSEAVELFGFRFDVGLDPIEVNLDRMLNAFRHGCEELGEVWSIALQPSTFSEIRKLAEQAHPGATSFHIDDDLWTRVVLDFACAHRKARLGRGHLLRSLTPLYLARVASFVIETTSLLSAQVEQKIEELCLCFERMKPYLIAHWDAEPAPAAEKPVPKKSGVVERANLEV
ncbi:MAG TPA: cell wall biosynthesis glycosyltransferase [Bryobacteraceae bacterium]|nr:cell wall biosynthesis glycosyltransferase [Bryobacteraceae bacterium]